MNFEEINANTIRIRNKLPKYNFFDISELAKTIPFWGFAPCQIDDTKFSMFLAGRDDGVALKFFWNGHYERQTLSIWRQLAQKSKMILDIGAHTGAYTLTALKASKKENVISFEPHHMNFARLSLNLRANGFRTKNLHMVGVGDKSEIKKFRTSMPIDYLPTGGSFNESSTAKNEFSFPIISIDNYLKNEIKEKIDLIKIDTEGYESECIIGMQDLIIKNKPTIFLESIDSKSSKKVGSFLSKIGYKFYLINDLKNTVHSVNDLEPIYNQNGTPDKYQLNRIATISKIKFFKYSTSESENL